jgi:hypothetical protein
VDAQYQITLSGLVNAHETVITIGANNLFDTDPPALTRFDSNGNRVATGVRPSYDGKVHDIRGRMVYFKLMQRF